MLKHSERIPVEWILLNQFKYELENITIESVSWVGNFQLTIGVQYPVFLLYHISGILS